jgi:ankyrin repeat protein
MAARMGLTKAIEHLLSLGQEIDVIDTSVSLRTPLHDAIAANQEDAVYMLIKFGAQLGHQDINGENAFHCAAKIGTRMLKVLYSNSDLSKADIQKLLSVTNIKLQFPEDRAANAITKDVLIELRQYGCRVTGGGMSKTKKRQNKSNTKALTAKGTSSSPKSLINQVNSGEVVE